MAPIKAPSALSLAAAREHFALKARTPISTIFSLIVWYFFLVELPPAVQARWPSLLAAAGGAWGLTWKGALGVNIAVQIAVNLFLLPIYASGVWDAYRCDASQPWPWRSPAADVRARFWATLAKSLPLVAFNAIVMAYAATWQVYPLAQWLGALRAGAADFPSPAANAAGVLLCLLVEDACFYATHRLLHTPFLYKHVHSWHHQYQTVVGPASEHAHPLEYSLGNLLPVVVGPLLFRVHLFTWFAFVLVRVVVSIDEHSGFALPWSPVRMLPWGASSEGHAWHHSHTDGMFASQFAWWDALCGSDKGFLEWQAARQAPGRKSE
jgi:sterol desaturase/sphingolipid hydroxylase (fatty acid hydroxylase superfamily)